MKFFWNKSKGLNADIEHHREQLAIFDANIAELEGKDDPMSIAVLRAYRRLRAKLLQSNADIVTKIGKK